MALQITNSYTYKVLSYEFTCNNLFYLRRTGILNQYIYHIYRCVHRDLNPDTHVHKPVALVNITRRTQNNGVSPNTNFGKNVTNYIQSYVLHTFPWKFLKLNGASRGRETRVTDFGFKARISSFRYLYWTILVVLFR